MRFLRIVVVSGIVLGAAAWVVVSRQPDWYTRIRYPLRYESVIRAHARNYELDPALLAAVIYTESRFNPRAVSGAGAIGLMQLLPETAKGIAIRTGGEQFVIDDLYDPELNIRYGSWYLRNLMRRYGDIRTALAAYHAGPGNVDAWRRDGEGIVFPETRAYVDKVTRLRELYSHAYAKELAAG